MGRERSILFLQVLVSLLGLFLLFLAMKFDSRSGGIILLGTMTILLASPWVFLVREVRDNPRSKARAKAIVVTSYLLFFFLIPILLMVITMV